MSLRRRPAVVLCLSILTLAIVPGVSLAAGHREPSRTVRAEGVFALMTDWAVRAWEGLTGVAPSPHGHLSGAAGYCIDPNGTSCVPTPPSNVTAPPSSGSGG